MQCVFVVNMPWAELENQYDDDDEYKPIWPSGLWATSQESETSKAYNRTQPFIEENLYSRVVL
jgi:hypothetical protein